MMRGFNLAVALFSLALAFYGCSRPKPEGPAERIGKGVDQIIGGVRDLDKDVDLPEREDERRYRRYEREYGRGPREHREPERHAKPGGLRYVPECDPLYDPQCRSDYWRGRDDAAGRAVERPSFSAESPSADSWKREENDRRY